MAETSPGYYFNHRRGRYETPDGEYYYDQDSGVWLELTGSMSRRDFLKLLTAGGASVLTGWLGLRSFLKEEPEKEVPLPVEPEIIINPDINKGTDQYTVPSLSQRDERWSNETLGLNSPHSDGTIGNYGCLITSLAAIKTAQGISETPTTINQKLLSANGYSHQGYFNRDTGFPALDMNLTWASGRYTDKPFNSLDLFHVRNFLDEGYPVMFEVNGNDPGLQITAGGSTQHFVVLNGYRQVHDGAFFYKFMDPWTGEHRELHQLQWMHKAWSASVFNGQVATRFQTSKPETTRPPLILNPNYQDGSSLPQNVLRWGPGIENYATAFGLDHRVIKCLIIQESGGNPEAVSKSDAIGLMQVMPREAPNKCKNGPCFADRPSRYELFDPDFNLFWGSKILRNYLNAANGDYTRALNNYYGSSDKLSARQPYSYAHLLLNIHMQNYYGQSYSLLFNQRT